MTSETGFQACSQFQCLKVHPMRGFKNHVPRWHMKVILISRTEFSAWNVGKLVHTASIIKMSRIAIDRLSFYDQFTGRFVVAKQTVKQTAQRFSPYARLWERTTPMHRNSLRFLSAPICSRDGVWNFYPRMTEITQIHLLIHLCIYIYIHLLKSLTPYWLDFSRVISSLFYILTVLANLSKTQHHRYIPLYQDHRYIPLYQRHR